MMQMNFTKARSTGITHIIKFYIFGYKKIKKKRKEKKRAFVSFNFCSHLRQHYKTGRIMIALSAGRQMALWCNMFWSPLRLYSSARWRCQKCQDNQVKELLARVKFRRVPMYGE